MPEAPWLPKADVPVVSAKPKQKATHNLRISYQRKQDQQLKPQKQLYCKVVLSDGSSKQGRLDGKGQAYFADVPAGSVKAYYGLTQKDADQSAQSAIQNEHQQKVAAFKKMLDGIIAQVKGRADKQRAALKKAGTFGAGWMYTESFFKGVGSGVWGLVSGTVVAAKDALVAVGDAECALGNTLMAAIKAGNAGPIKAKFHELKTDIEADAKTFEKLARLLSDPEVQDALESFPARYFHEDSGLDEVNMIGKFAPALVLAVVTLGGAAAVEGSAGAAVVAEEIGGEVGTIERLAAATEDAGDIEKVDNVLDTVKDDEAAKRALAKDFYLKSGFDADRADDHMRGIDFQRPVVIRQLPPGMLLEQKVSVEGVQGRYYSNLDIPASELGINPNIRDIYSGDLVPKVVKRYKLIREIQVLESYAAPVIDDWSDSFKPYSTVGGAKQYFTTEKDYIEEISYE